MTTGVTGLRQSVWEAPASPRETGGRVFCGSLSEEEAVEAGGVEIGLIDAVELYRA